MHRTSHGLLKQLTVIVNKKYFVIRKISVKVGIIL